MDYYFTKHPNITTIYNDDLNTNYLQKVFEMPSLKAWVKRPSGQIKRGEKHKRF
jgi:hypothetical protein